MMDGAAKTLSAPPSSGRRRAHLLCLPPLFLRLLRLSGLRQHVLNQDPVALGRLVDHHVGHRPHNLPVLQNRAAAHE